MSQTIELIEVNNLVATSNHKFAKWPFENFNIVQSSIFETIEKDCNCLIAASTSAGKTVISEMYGSYEIRKNRKKFLFLCPLRALANEKYYDWTHASHHFSDLKIGIFTGDYKKDNKLNDFDSFDVIIMTSEMLNHKLRTSKKNQDWVKNIGVCVVDESHLLTVEGRGDHLEAALMNFSTINPQCRMVFLSATLPNVHEIAEWMSVSLNQKPTYIIKSKYRPCVLNIHTKTYDDQSGVRSSIYEMIDEACELVLRHFSDKFLIFVHAKKIGETFVEELKRKNIKAEFHNANLDKDQREKLETKFKSDKEFRVLVATSTLAWGVNLPARRVIIAGVTRGNEVVPSYDVLQMIGRAGRPAFDPQGDAYILFPANRRTELEKVVLTPQNIESRMLAISALTTYDTLAFHIVYEIHVENVKNIDDIKTWFSKTLASFQNKKLSDSILEKTVSRLVMLGIIGIDDATQSFFIKGLGKVSALFYANPYDVANWSSNFNKLFQNQQIYDIDLSLALANTSSNLVGNLSKEDKNEMEKFLSAISKRSTKQYPENVLKIAFLYYKIMNGRYEARHISVYKNLQNDFPRVSEILKGIDSIAKGWNQKQFFDVLQKRMQHGVPAKLVDLIEVKGIGKIKAEKLYEKGFKNKKDVLQKLEEASKVCGLKPDTLKKYCD